jgi:hypothetical protein
MFITTAYQGPDGVPPVAEPLMTTPLVCATGFGPDTKLHTLARDPQILQRGFGAPLRFGAIHHHCGFALRVALR